MVELQDVTKKVGAFSLRNISFALPDGYIMGLIGENGSGKTTLLRILLGLYRETEGVVLFDGKSYQEDRKAISEQIGYVLQDELFQIGLSLEKNGMLYGAYYANYDQEKFLLNLQEFALEKKKKYGKLSKGERLKFQFAFALAYGPKYLILDEPVGNFDPEFRKIFYQKITQYVSDGQHSVILASHLTNELERIVDYVTFLRKGKLVFSQTIEEMRERYRIVSGEAYKIKLIPKEDVLYMETGEYGARALVRHYKRVTYDRELFVEQPTMEQLMYFWKKGDLA
ncbi:MAG: ATP-binding cassette domain-containing protein [Roseburia sp.]